MAPTPPRGNTRTKGGGHKGISSLAGVFGSGLHVPQAHTRPRDRDWPSSASHPGSSAGANLGRSEQTARLSPARRPRSSLREQTPGVADDVTSAMRPLQDPRTCLVRATSGQTTAGLTPQLPKLESARTPARHSRRFRRTSLLCRAFTSPPPSPRHHHPRHPPGPPSMPPLAPPPPSTDTLRALFRTR